MGLSTATDTQETNTPKSDGGFTLGQSSTDLVGIHGAPPTAQQVVANLLGTLTGTVDGTINDVAAAACAGAATPTAAQVDTAVAALSLSTNLALKEIFTKLNELIDAAQTKGIIG